MRKLSLLAILVLSGCEAAPTGMKTSPDTGEPMFEGLATLSTSSSTAILDRPITLITHYRPKFVGKGNVTLYLLTQQQRSSNKGVVLLSPDAELSSTPNNSLKIYRQPVNFEAGSSAEQTWTIQLRDTSSYDIFTSMDFDSVLVKNDSSGKSRLYPVDAKEVLDKYGFLDPHGKQDARALSLENPYDR